MVSHSFINVLCSLLVESMVDLALASHDWTWCSTDFAPYDFRHADGTRLEVKQSAALQSWSNGGLLSRASFDIGTRKSASDGQKLVVSETPIRHANLYIMAYHPVADREVADHRNPSQWLFYVIPTSKLPAARSIALSKLHTMVEPVTITLLMRAIEAARIMFQGQHA